MNDVVDEMDETSEVMCKWTEGSGPDRHYCGKPESEHFFEYDKWTRHRFTPFGGDEEWGNGP